MKQVVLIGDSIRMRYQAMVAEAFETEAEVWGPEENGGTSENVLAHFDEWVVDRRPEVLHLNAGLHDLGRWGETREPRVGLEAYKENVREILRRATTQTDAAVIWALTTPVNERWHHDRKEFDRLEADVAAYNDVAIGAAREFGVAVNDLHATVMEAGRDDLLEPDGVHFTERGSRLLADAVAAAVRQHL
jgi:lysophospholipase L1-like esterase